jgi:hypothetical protein
MTSIVVNEPLIGQFRGAKGFIEVRGEDGIVVGYFSPVSARSIYVDGRLVDLYAEFDLAAMEKEKARNGKNGVPLAEIYEQMKAMTSEPEWHDHLQEQINRLKERDRCDTP